MPKRPKFELPPNEALGVSADLATLAGIVAAVGPAVVGYLAGSAIAGLGAALVATLLVVVYLIARVRRLTVQVHRLTRRSADHSVRMALARGMLDSYLFLTSHFERLRDSLSDSQYNPPTAGDTDRSEVQDVPSAGDPPSEWLTDPLDLRTFVLSPATLDQCQERALELALHELGDSARAWLIEIELYTNVFGSPRPGLPRVTFAVGSPSVARQATVHFRGSLDAVAASYANIPLGFLLPVRPSRHDREVPWRTDAHYQSLVHDAWRAIQPMGEGAVTLRHVRRDRSGLPSPWLVSCLAVGSKIDAVRQFTWEDGRLVEVAGARSGP